MAADLVDLDVATHRRRGAGAPDEEPAGTASADRRSHARTVAVAALALFLVYGALSFLDDPRGTLGSDSGAKVATVRVMGERGSLVPDIGYWAQRYDPDGSLHPMYNSAHVGEHWVDVTTLPMLVAAYPLYQLGGLRAVLVLPMLGGILTALAARALARRLRGGDGWWAFWSIGIATPIAVYALDFWEHSLGVAAIAWAVVFVLDVADRRAGWRGALGAGALFGVAATMRTEALVYALVAIGAVVLAYIRRGGTDLRTVAARVAATVTGIVAVALANEMLERVIIGSSLRAGRASATAGDAAGGPVKRLEEALSTTFGLTRFPNAGEWALGAVLVIAIGLSAWALTRDHERARHVAVAALATAGFVYALRFGTGLGFVPGMLTASPLAVAGIVLWRREPAARRLVALAVAALPLVWVFQYSGGAGPQWGGRYVLVSGMLLAVGAVVALHRVSRVAVSVFVIAGVAVSACGVAWLSARSHAVADAMERLEARHDEVLVSRERFLLREGGAFYSPDRRWLSAASDHGLREAFAVTRRAGLDDVGLVQAPGRPRPRTVAGFVRGHTERVDFFPHTPVTVTTYQLP